MKSIISWCILMLIGAGCCLGALCCLAKIAHGETLHIQCTAPLQNNGGSCVSPALSQADSRDSLWVIFEINGPSLARRDSVWRRPGGNIDLRYTAAPGLYKIVARGLRVSAGGTLFYGCPAEKTTIVVPAVPGMPTFGP